MMLLAAITGLSVPKPAECPDPIQGTWVGIERRPSGWLHYTVQVHSPAEGILQGTILGHFWGTPDRTPPRCTDYAHDQFIAHQSATGTFLDGKLDFEALAVDRIERRCGRVRPYLADHLTGHLRAPSVIDVVSDDGGAPPSHVVLTRIACHSPGA
ncbi:MAG: hypothetical protein AAGA48_34345 [Myxococcota bacterium]